ncbi:MAG TPA: sortase [Candidatus Dormibacteraeota bacterium]|nr:sortase [Candidatus Dormibacteraeota bacterium]
MVRALAVKAPAAKAPPARAAAAKKPAAKTPALKAPLAKAPAARKPLAKAAASKPAAIKPATAKPATVKPAVKAAPKPAARAKPAPRRTARAAASAARAAAGAAAPTPTRRPAGAKAPASARAVAAGTPVKKPAAARRKASAPAELVAAAAPAVDDPGTVISEWPPKMEAPPEVRGRKAPAATAPPVRTRRSRRGGVIAALVALATGVVLSAFSLGLPLPTIGPFNLSQMITGSSVISTPSSGGWTTWVIIAAVVVAVLMVGLAIATSEKKGWRFVLDTRVVGLVAALVLVGVGLTQLFPPGAQFDIRELPNLAGNALQGIGAQPESGYPRIRISRVSIDLLLVKGDGKTPPVKYEAFTFPNADHLLAANSDGTGNSYVYAHARNGMFWRLHDMRIGDNIEVDYGNNKVYKYRVAEIHPQVNWRDLTWLQPTPDDRLTLQTCNGWKDDDPRFIVVARRVSDQTAINSGQ